LFRLALIGQESAFHWVSSPSRGAGAVDCVARLLGLLGVAMPVFLVGLISVLIFAVSAQILPTGGRCDVQPTEFCGSHLKHLILPVASLSIFWTASVALYLRQAIRAEVKMAPDSKPQLRHLVVGTLLSLLRTAVLIAGICAVKSWWS
jgi:hypothetical protein